MNLNGMVVTLSVKNPGTPVTTEYSKKEITKPMNSSLSFGKFLILLIVFSIFQPWQLVGASDQKGMKVIIKKAPGSRLLIWCPWVDDPIRKKFLTVAARKFQKRTGSRVEIFLKNKNDLQKKLAVDWGRKKSSPDISYIDPGFKQRRIGAALLELNNLSLSAGRDPFWKLGDAGGGSKNYLPIEGHATAIFYNKVLFLKAGIKLPKDRLLNADEFLEIVKTLRSKGITPIAEGVAGQERKAAVPIFNTMIRFAGYDKIRKLMRQEINFSDPDIIRSLTYWKKIVDAGGYECPESLQLNLSDSILEIMENRAAISFCDTLSYAKISAKWRIRGRVGVLDWFNVPEGKGNNTFGHTYGAGYGVNRHSRRVGLAKQFLQFLITPSAAQLWAKYVQSPYPIPLHIWPSDSIYDELAAQRTNQTQTEGVDHLFFQKSALNDLWSEMTRDFICGRISVDDFIHRMNSKF
jgi:ABC-type glycerol-3-phosphate transport system substrate-binding protein